MARVVITGAAGGTGQSLVAHFRAAGYEVVAVDVRPVPQAVAPAVQLDLCQAAGVNDVVAGADAVVHFGSPPAISHLAATEAFHQVGVAGFNVFQAARNAGVRRLVWASSIEVYGDLTAHPSLPVTESSPLAPPSLYGACKVMLENLAVDYYRWYGICSAGFRLTRIIYDNPQGRAKLRGLVAQTGAGADCLWSYVDARDVASACQAWLESEHPGAEVFNVAAPDVHHPVSTAQLLAGSAYRAAWVAAGDAHETPFCTHRIRARLGWRPRYHWRQLLAEEEAPSLSGHSSTSGPTGA